jgi:hypothetical protein
MGRDAAVLSRLNVADEASASAAGQQPGNVAASQGARCRLSLGPLGERRAADALSLSRESGRETNGPFPGSTVVVVSATGKTPTVFYLGKTSRPNSLP